MPGERGRSSSGAAGGVFEVTTAARGMRAGASRAAAAAGAPGARSTLCKAALFARFRGLVALCEASGAPAGAAAQLDACRCACVCTWALLEKHRR